MISQRDGISSPKERPHLQGARSAHPGHAAPARRLRALAPPRRRRDERRSRGDGAPPPRRSDADTRQPRAASAVSSSNRGFFSCADHIDLTSADQWVVLKHVRALVPYDTYVPNSAQTLRLKAVRASPPHPAGHRPLLNYALPGIPDNDPPLVGGLTVTPRPSSTREPSRATSSSTSSWPVLIRKACRCASASRLRTARSRRGQQAKAGPGDPRRRLGRGRVRGRRRLERPREVIGDALSASASSSR